MLRVVFCMCPWLISDRKRERAFGKDGVYQWTVLNKWNDIHIDEDEEMNTWFEKHITRQRLLFKQKGLLFIRDCGSWLVGGIFGILVYMVAGLKPQTHWSCGDVYTRFVYGDGARWVAYTLCIQNCVKIHYSRGTLCRAHD